MTGQHRQDLEVGNRHEGTFCVDGNVLDHDYDGSITAYVCQNTLNCTLKIVDFYDI